jgi:hypothetical protein
MNIIYSHLCGADVVAAAQNALHNESAAQSVKDAVLQKGNSTNFRKISKPQFKMSHVIIC